MTDKEKVLVIIQNEVLTLYPSVNPRASTLYGSGGILDSLDLVTLVIGVEEKVNKEFNTNITIASDRTMSHYNSPFLNMDTMSEFILELINENNANHRN